MPYAPDFDNANEPLDSEFASTAAAEFRAIKTKLNLLYQGASLDEDLNALYSERGMFFVNDNDADGVTFAMWAAAGRTGGTNSVIGAQLTAVVNNGVQLGAAASCIGANVLAVQSNGATDSGAALVGVRAVVLNSCPDGSLHDWIVGIESRFQNRGDGDTDPPDGFSFEYNQRSAAIRITSQRRSTNNSPCGWSRGIFFDPYSLDQDFGFPNAHAFAIDFRGLADYDSDLPPVPFNFSGNALESTPTDNIGAYAMPTTLMGFIRVTLDDNPIYGIPLMSVPTDVPP